MSYQSVITDPVALAQRHHAAAGVLLPSAIEFIIHVLGNNRAFFDEMRGYIKPEYFIIEERLLSLTWSAMCQVADVVAGDFQYETLALALQAIVVNQQDSLTDDEQATLFAPDESGILWTMTKGQYAPAHVAYARGLLMQFLTERTVVNPLKLLLHGNEYPGNFNELLNTITEHSSRISALNEIPRVSVAPVRGTTAYEPPLEYCMTGVSYVDRPLGGQIRGDANGLIACTGGGKTTTAVHMAVEGARVCWSEALEAGTTPEFVAYVSIEEEGKKIRPRAWSAAFLIPLDKLRKMRDWSELTTPANIDPYERAIGVDPNNPHARVRSESERYDEGQPMLARCFELLDFSGAGEYKESGGGYLEAIISALDRIRDIRQQPLRTVFLDYAGLLVARSLGGSADDRKVRTGLKRLGDQFRQLANRFSCTAWLLHQVRGAVGNQSPLKLLSHHDASETKDFADNLALCGCIGTHDTVTGCRRLNWSKTRNVRVESVTPLTLRINDQFAQMEDVTPLYMIDEVSRQFMHRTHVQPVANASMPAATPAALPGGNRGRPQVGAVDTQAALDVADFNNGPG